jgi:hypothetical protein
LENLEANESMLNKIQTKLIEQFDLNGDKIPFHHEYQYVKHISTCPEGIHYQLYLKIQP